MKIKISEATPLQLNWLVAKAEGHEVMLFDDLWRSNAQAKGYLIADVEHHLNWQPQKGQQVIVELRYLQLDQRNPENTTPTRCARNIPNYSTDWSQSGMIIEREKIGMSMTWSGTCWLASAHDIGAKVFRGPTPLVAAMRCYCHAKLGDEVEIPEELAS